MSQRQIEHRHGSLLAVSHGLHRKISLLEKTGELSQTNASEWSELKQVVNLLIENLTDQQTLLVSAAIKGISLIGSVLKLPLPERSNNSSGSSSSSTSLAASTYDPDEKMEVDDETNEFTKSYVAQKILYLLKSAHSRPKIRVEPAYCLGHLAIGDPAYFTAGNLSAFTKMIKLVCVDNN